MTSSIHSMTIESKWYKTQFFLAIFLVTTFSTFYSLSSDDDGEGAGEMDAPSESKPTLSEIAKTKYKQTSLYDIPQCDICKKT